jgi:hypothetical protein
MILYFQNNKKKRFIMKTLEYITLILTFTLSPQIYSQELNNTINFGEGIPLEFEGFVQQDIGYEFSENFFANKYTINLR